MISPEKSGKMQNFKNFKFLKNIDFSMFFPKKLGKYRTFFCWISKKYFFSESKKKVDYSFDAKKLYLSIGGIFRAIRASEPLEIRWITK